ncbi:MAG TPA: hypothetical protein VEN12_08700 [Verrucomicrobiae bacterium]|nr:hypothetical protein [Verrucomicrobiae bacterium]
MGRALRAGACVGIVLAGVLASPVPVAATTPAPVAHSELPRPSDNEKRSRPAHPGSLRIANAANTVTPSGSWSWQNPKPNGNTLLTIDCPSALVCYAAGEYGPILSTAYGGATWSQHGQFTQILGISCAGVSQCSAVGANGQYIGAGSPVGTVYIGVWVKDSASPTSTFDANAATTVTVT